MTPRQLEIFLFIAGQIISKYPPTLREIGVRFGFTVKGACDHVSAIYWRGYLNRVAVYATDKTYSRALMISPTGYDVLRQTAIDSQGNQYVRVEIKEGEE